MPLNPGYIPWEPLWHILDIMPHSEFIIQSSSEERIAQTDEKIAVTITKIPITCPKSFKPSFSFSEDA